MNHLTPGGTEVPGQPAAEHRSPKVRASAVRVQEYVIEVISDSGEGAQKCGQSLASIAAKMGNGIWTVEIIPAEIEPPPRSIAGASGNRIRIGSYRVVNGGDEADLAVADGQFARIGLGSRLLARTVPFVRHLGTDLGQRIGRFN